MIKRIAATLGAASLAAAAFIASTYFTAAGATDDVNRSMMDYAFARAVGQFYKPTNDQTLLDGAVSGMRVAVAAGHGDPKKVPALRSKGSPDADTAALNSELAVAAKKFGPAVSEQELAIARSLQFK